MKLTVPKRVFGIIALSIVLLLAGLAFVGWRVLRDLHRITTIDDVTVISGQMAQHYQAGKAPTQAEIDAHITGLIKRPVDVYGTPFRLHHTVQGALHRLTATSAGPDRQFDTPDDVSREATWETLASPQKQ